jgi:hypothetical protein
MSTMPKGSPAGADVIRFPNSRRPASNPRVDWVAVDQLLVAARSDLNVAKTKKRKSLIRELVTDARDALDRWLAETAQG